VKSPSRGRAKTRIAAVVGAARAAEIYRALVERLLQGIAALDRVELHYTPSGARREIRCWLRPGWSAQPQAAGDLGARLTAAFDGAFAAGTRRVCIIGSDCPEVTAADIHRAWRKLRDHDLVLGPAEDGGYWLIGLGAPQPGLFVGMPWSTSAVLERTVARAGELGLRVARLRTLRDIDTWEDWRRFEADRGGF
jgi:rSAM/selenodomain-associated transferase 1